MLSWDGSFLGEYPLDAIVQRWYMNGVLYYGIALKDEFIYVTVHRVKDLFPLIVNDLKAVFDLPRRALHYIKFSGSIYILYPVPMTPEGDLIWEVPLNQISINHQLRSDPEFQDMVRKLFVFCDLLSLPDSDETNIIIQANQIPINNNETRTTIIKETLRDFNILPASVIKLWFADENIFIERIVCDMLHYQITNNSFEILMFDLRAQIETIIRKYDRNYIWYTNFVADRVSRSILSL
jgi:hypothetical protein